MGAASNGHIAAVSALLAAGANVNIRDHVSTTGTVFADLCMFSWWLE